MHVEQNTFFNSDEKILSEIQNPTFKTKFKKVCFKITPYLTGFAIKLFKITYNLIVTIVALKTLLTIFNIHILIF